MTNRSNDPVADHAREVIRQAIADAKQIRTLNIEDVLKQPVSIDGLSLDSHVTIIVRQVGNAAPEVDYVDVRSVSIIPNGPEWNPILIENFESRHKSQYKAFVAAVEAEALKQAKNAPDSAWDYETDGE